MVDNGPPIDPEGLRPLYYAAGLSLQACQVLEYDLKYFLWLGAAAGIAPFTSQETADLLEGRSRKTLGQTLSLARQRGIKFSANGEADLAQALDARNQFIHGFLMERVESIADPRRRPEVIREIRAVRKVVLRGDSFLRLFIPGLQAATGTDPAKFEASLAAEVRALNLSGIDAE